MTMDYALVGRVGRKYSGTSNGALHPPASIELYVRSLREVAELTNDRRFRPQSRVCSPAVCIRLKGMVMVGRLSEYGGLFVRVESLIFKSLQKVKQKVIFLRFDFHGGARASEDTFLFYRGILCLFLALQWDCIHLCALLRFNFSLSDEMDFLV